MITAIDCGEFSTSTLLWFGSLEKHGVAGKPGKKASQQSVASRSELLEIGWGVVQRWPERFLQTLARERMPAPSGAISVFSEAFPTIPRLLRRLRDRPWREKVALCLRAMAQESLEGSQPILYRAQRASAPQPNSSTETPRITPSNPVIAQEPGSPIRITKAGRLRRTCPAKLLRGPTIVSQRTTVRQVAKLLEISRIRAQGLPAGYGERASEIRALILSISRPSSLSDAAQLVDWATVLRFIVPRGLTVHFLDAITGKQIQVFHNGIDADKLRSLALSRSEVMAWVDAHRPDECLMTVAQAARLMGKRQEQAYFFVKCGLLRSVRGRTGSRQSTAVSADAVQDFLHQFIPLRELAGNAGVASRKAREWADTNGVTLIAGPDIDGSRQYWARRPTP